MTKNEMKELHLIRCSIIGLQHDLHSYAEDYDSKVIQNIANSVDNITNRIDKILK